MNKQAMKTVALAVGLVLAFTGIAQEADDTEDAAAVAEAPPSDEALAEEDAAVQEVLDETDDIVYREDEGSEDFIPSQGVSADQSIDYPVDI